MDEGRSIQAEPDDLPISTPKAATVSASARLHFGFLDPSGRSERPFGSFGLSIDRPVTKLTLKRASSLKVSGPEAKRAAQYLSMLAEARGQAPAYELAIEEAIPPHSGLGSGTQLALAVGAAFAALEDAKLTSRDLAQLLGRGARSGIGLATFAAGGAVLDSGPVAGALPQLVARVPFPNDWRVLLIFDADVSGIHGGAEAEAFAEAPGFPRGEVDALRASVIDRALPALEIHDFDGFTAEIGLLQATMGTYFASLQGGAIVSPKVADVLDWAAGKGLKGLGQSSWGPTGFVFVRSEADAAALLAAAQKLSGSEGLSFQLARGLNRGAQISVY